MLLEMRSSVFLSLVAALPAVYGVAFGGPEPTGSSPDRALDGFSPKPTNGPSLNELRKRQSGSDTCGWLDGDFSSALTCKFGRTCMLYKSASSSMAGCCDGSDTQNCGWVNSCVDYSSYVGGSCGTSCLLDNFVMKCTELSAKYCIKYTYPGQGVSDYGCASASPFGALTIRQTATNGLGSTYSTSLPTVAAGALSETTGTGGSGGYTGGSGYTGSNGTTSTRTKKLAIGVIVGIVIAVLAILFFIIIGVVMIMKKKKKQKQIAANAQIIAANRPQSEFHPQPPQEGQYMQPQMQQQMQQGPPMPTQSPQPTNNGYFAPPGQEQKYNNHTSVHEHSAPISNPSTPAPAYAQPYMANAPPMPGQYQPPANGAHEVPSPMSSQQTGQYQAPANGAHEVSSPVMTQPYNQGVSPVQQQPYAPPPMGAHEVDASSMPHAPGKTGPVYEMGQGR